MFGFVHCSGKLIVVYQVQLQTLLLLQWMALHICIQINRSVSVYLVIQASKGSFFSLETLQLHWFGLTPVTSKLYVGLTGQYVGKTFPRYQHTSFPPKFCHLHNQMSPRKWRQPFHQKCKVKHITFQYIYPEN